MLTENGAEKEEKSQQMVFYRVRDETGGLDLEARGDSKCYPSDSLAGISGVSRNVSVSWRLRQREEVVEKGSKNYLGNLWE